MSEKAKKTYEKLVGSIELPEDDKSTLYYVMSYYGTKSTTTDYHIKKSVDNKGDALFTMKYSHDSQWADSVKGKVLFKASIICDEIIVTFPDDSGALLQDNKLNMDYGGLYALKIFTDFIYNGMESNNVYKIVEVARQVKKK